MIKFERLIKARYDECLPNPYNTMNVHVFEYLHKILEGKIGDHDDTSYEYVVSPLMECHREFFDAKVVFMDSIIHRLVAEIEPTSLSANDRIELKKILNALSEAHNMVFLVWAAEQLLEAIKTNPRQKT